MKPIANNYSFFSKTYEKDLAIADELNRQSSRLTTMRTVTFILLVFSFAAGYDGHTVGTMAGILLLVSFCLLVRRHSRLKKKQQFTACHTRVVKDFLSRFDGSWQDFADDGSALQNKDQPQQIDLHLFGPASFYQYLSCARTLRGKKRLAAALTTTPPSRQKIMARQESVAELIGQKEFALQLLAQAAQLPDRHDTTELLNEIEAPLSQGSHAIVRYRTAWILPAITLLSLLLAAFTVVSWTIPGLLLGLQFLLATAFHQHNQTILAPLNHLTHELHFYEAIFRDLEAADFQAASLSGLKLRLQTGQASGSLHRLAALTDAVALTRNFFFALLANTLLLWDCHMAARFTRWHELASGNLREWMDIWSEFEVLLSLAVIGQTREQWTFPELKDGQPSLCARDLSSLLFAENKAVPNDASFTAGTCILTGSNMSGKTTYMRTLAGAVVLAYAGAPVCARAFSLTPLHIFTSIQVNDDMSLGISTFYAELLRIKQMVTFSQRELPMLICIDEIFKGTNSADRIIGAREAIKQLTRAWCITLVTTHDFELCDLKSPNDLPVTNCHFEEYYEDNKIKFDYKLKPGRCQTTNARYLLRMAGILSSE